VKSRVYSVLISLILLNIHPVLFADYDGKVLSDAEIRKFIIQGDLNQFNRGACYKRTLVPVDPPLPPADVGDDTNTGKLTLGNYRRWNYEIDQEAKRKVPIPKPSPIYRCQCPCPYSRNSRNEECGVESAYFQYPGEKKPKCYPEDVQDWEVDDFRNLHEIPK
jgi:hypothetical protein